MRAGRPKPSLSKPMAGCFLSGFTKVVCNRGGFKRQGSMDIIEIQTPCCRPHLGSLDSYTTSSRSKPSQQARDELSQTQHPQMHASHALRASPAASSVRKQLAKPSTITELARSALNVLLLSKSEDAWRHFYQHPYCNTSHD